MRKPPVPRERVYDLYWRFAAERQSAFERRVAGLPPPWTDDTIISAFKFCNVYRAADRVSQYLIREVAYHEEPGSEADRLFQIIAFRMFSKIDTWSAVREDLGRQPTLRDLSTGAFANALDRAKAANGGLYTGAFILCATSAYGHATKHLNHVALFKAMFGAGAASRLLSARSLQCVYEILHQYPLLGDFMAYQLAIDLNYSALMDYSEDEFTQPGPGALRGIRKVFEAFGDYAPAEIVSWMVDRQDEEFARLGLNFGGLWGRKLHAIDCQGLFCEVDKYCREAVPELKSSRKRIKSRFFPSLGTLKLFFPPKWGINHKLPTGPVLGAPGSRDGHTATQQKLLAS